MGNRLTDDQRQAEPRSYGDIFDELFPHYLLMGMTPEQYWDGESGLKKAFRKAYQMRIEMEQRTADRNNWYMGQYLIAVLQSVPLLVGGLNVKRTTQLPEYPREPFLEKALTEKKKEVREKKQKDQMTLAMALFQAGVEKFNQNIRKRLADQNAKAEVNTGQ